MPSKSKPSPATGCVTFLAFLVLLGLFVDAAWVLGQKVWMHAFGERTGGHLVDSHSYSKKDKRGRSYRVSVHDYQYTDASGRIHVGQTGHKSVLFNRERYPISSGRDVPKSAPRVTVLYLRSAPSTSWALEYEPDWGESFFLAGVIFVPMAISGLGTFAVLKSDPAQGASPPPAARQVQPSPPRVAIQPLPDRRRKQKKKQAKR